MKLLELKDISKQYGTMYANDKISLQMEKGEIRALLGENGAGKTTLVKMICGLSKPTEGEIFWKGKKVDFHNPSEARKCGISMVHQHFMLADELTVLENITLGISHIGAVPDYRKIKEKVTRLMDSVGLSVPLNLKVGDLSIGFKQRAEIVRALYNGTELLILDEPTAVLTPQEIKNLLEVLRTLKEQGCSIILISHKLNEIMEICDSVSILRDGRLIQTLAISSTDTNELARLMVGREVNMKLEKAVAEKGKRLLKIENLTVKDDFGTRKVKKLNLEIAEGEIVGVAGVEGNGQKELADCLFGVRKPEEGHVYFEEEDITFYSARQRRNIGIGRVPEDRQKTGLIMGFSVNENLNSESYMQRPYSKGGMLNPGKMMEFSHEMIKRFGIKVMDAREAVDALSGGNQQKVILARELCFSPKLLIIVNPTRGMDVGASEYIYQKIFELKKQGSAVLLISTELDEILTLSDRVEVIFDGNMIGSTEATGDQIWEIGRLMAGIKPEAKE
ncbi:MAG: ABC transporter ATP-binding protein [Lachnospiraceae bacterium]|nr:ABC transporter ATP-binding protein [Lachnospiraceae bacterium]